MRSGFARSAGLPTRNKSMLLALLLLMSAIYLWVAKEDAVANQYASCSRLGLSSAPPRTLVLFPQSLLGRSVSRALAKAGHAVFVLLDEPSGVEGAAEREEIASLYAAQEIVPVTVRGGVRNVTGVLDLLVQQGVQSVLDTRAAAPGGAGSELDGHMLELARGMAALYDNQGSGAKRTFVYTSGCAMHALDTPEERLAQQQQQAPAGAPTSDASADFESLLHSLGSARNAGVHTIVLRPGVLYGGAAWTTSPVRHWIHAAETGSPAAAIAPPSGAGMQQGGYPALTLRTPLASALSSAPFRGLHLSDAVSAFVSLTSATPSSLAALSGGSYDLLDETRVSNGVVAQAFLRAAVAGDAVPLPGSEESHPSRNAAHFAHPSEEQTQLHEEEGEGQVTRLTSNYGATQPVAGRAARHLLRIASAAAGLVSSSGPGSTAAAAAAASHCPAPSKTNIVKFQTITRWRAAHRRVSEPDRMHTYVRAIRTAEKRDATRRHIARQPQLGDRSAVTGTRTSTRRT